MGGRSYVLALTLLAGCGRIAFDATSDANGAADVADSDPSLLLWFNFESGVTVDSATQHHATCSSCPGITAGPRGDAGDFDGVADCLYIDVPAQLQPSVLTWAVWARTEENRIHTFFGSPYNSDLEINNSFEIFSVQPDEAIVLINALGAVVSLPPLEWHHIAGTYDGTTLRAYRDGVEVGSTSVSPPLYSPEPYRIGCDRDAGTELAYVFGAIDDVRLYNRALSPAEVAALAQ